MKKKNFLAKGRSLLLFLAFSSLTFFSAQTGPTDDWDGDGILNQTDLDDDNDGILDTNENLTSSVNAIINGNFGTNGTTGGNLTGWVTNGTGTSSLTNWAAESGGAVSYMDGAEGLNLSQANVPLKTASTPAFATFSVKVFSINAAGTSPISQGWGNVDFYLQTTTGLTRIFRVSNPLTATLASPTTNIELIDSSLVLSLAVNGNYISRSFATGSLVTITVNINTANLASSGMVLIQRKNGAASGPNGQIGADDFFIDDVSYTYQIGTDTDSDGIPNHLDLDSDGDGCPDAVEAGTATQAGAGNTSAGTIVNTGGSQTGVANAIVGNNTPAAYGANGFYTGIETNDTSSAAYTGTYTYNQYAIVSTLNACTDTDGDGIPDVTDIDDDNDGIVDAAESPACFYTAAEANVISKITSQFTSPDDDQTDGDIQLLHNGATALTFNFNAVTAAANPTGSNLFTIEYPTSLQLATLSVSQRISATANANAVVVGSNDGITWSAALSPATLITTTPTVFTITATQPYKYYRIQTGSTPGALAAANTIGEITSTVAASYIPSAHQKPVICSVDTDGDTTPNHLDLDSDGDGCSDSVEAGNTPFTANNTTTFNTGTDANNNGLLDQFENGATGTINYNSTYSFFAINPTISACLDSDGDSIPDVTDIDDDNDGVLDTAETLCSPTGNLTVTATGSYTIHSNNDITFNETGQVILDYPYSFQKFNLLLRDLDQNDNIAIYVTLDDGTSVGPLDGRLFFSNTDPSWVSRWNGYSVAGYAQLVEFTGAPYASGEVFYEAPAKGWGALEFTIPQATSINGIDKVIINMNPGSGFNAFLDIEPLDILPNCTDIDTDTDGIPNRLDLDSDGDGCPDAVEAGTATQAGAGNTSAGTIVNTGGSQTGVANAIVGNNTPAAYGANGFYSGIETNDTSSAAYTGQYTYNQYAIVNTLNACTDTDGDGIPDLFDIDDDNDGIVDATESPACFYTAAEANVISKVTSQFTSPDDDQTDGDIQLLHDGAAALTFNFNAVTAAANPTGSNLFTIEYPTSLQLATLSVSQRISATANANAVVVGSNDGITWSAALSPATLITATPTVFTITATQPYKYYRIQTGSTAGALAAANTIGEITSTVATSYIPSAHQKPIICSVDTDGDTIPNHLDLDSDADGCSDLAESGVSPITDIFTPANGSIFGISNPTNSQLNPIGTDNNNDGLNDSVDSDLNSITNYTSTYNQYAIVANINACIDTDGDGITDITDIDDDNDGVLDTIESTFNPYLNTACENNLIERMGYTSAFTLNNQVADKIGLIVGTNNTFTTGFPMGAACATISFGDSAATFNTYIYFKFVNPYNTTEQVPLNYMTLTSDCAGSNEIAEYDAYDINGNFLYNQTLTTPPYGANYCVTIQPPANVNVYSIRVRQVLSAAILSGISLKGISNYNDLDTDGDGIPNRLDLDSDGDGCPDAVEAGTATQAGAGNTSSGTIVNTGGSQTGVANAIVGNNTPAAYGANGFYSGVETNDTPSAAYTGQYTYNQYAVVSTLNACTDTDGDGIPDLFDIDDDNDGIVDATESPACFYTAAEANVISKITSQFTSPDDNQTDGDIQLLHDGAAALTFNFNAVTAAANPTGSNLLTIEYPTSLQLATLSVSDNITTTANANAVVVGSNDGITWSTALSPATLITATPTVFNITATQPYKYYRIQTGSTPGALAIANTIGEITSTVAASYIPSAHQKPVICSVDTDGDTIPNHLDLDSDGDGCSDLAESGVSPATDVITPSTTNNAGGSYGIASPNGSQLNPTAADTNNDGLNDSVDSDLNNITNYTSTYSNAINSAITACTLFCYRPAVTAGTVLDTQKGITSLGRAGVSNSNWPMVRKGGWIALEAKTKGFVPNRLSTAEINAIPAANLVEGMMVYNITLDCLQINTDGTAAGWKCFNTQACP